MNSNMHRYDPWGPISSTLYTINDSDLVENLIGLTGLLTLSSHCSTHKERIREYKGIIQAAYAGLPDDKKGRFAQIVAKGLLNSSMGNLAKKTLNDSLNDIGWTVIGDG